VKLLAVSERDEHKSRICCTETGNPGGDVAIGAIERHTVTCSELMKPLVCQNCPNAKQT